MLNIDIGCDALSDEQIIQEFNCPVKYKRVHLYSIMAMRANKNEKIKEYLFELIMDKEKRQEYFLNTIIHAWLPVLHILPHGTEALKIEMKSVLRQWTYEEKILFLNYIKKEKAYYDLLSDILD